MRQNWNGFSLCTITPRAKGSVGNNFILFSPIRYAILDVVYLLFFFSSLIDGSGNTHWLLLKYASCYHTISLLRFSQYRYPAICLFRYDENIFFCLLNLLDHPAINKTKCDISVSLSLFFYCFSYQFFVLFL